MHPPNRSWASYLIWAATGLVFGIDALFRQYAVPLPVAALIDETAHVITALLLLVVLGVSRLQPFSSTALLASVLIDGDHLPMELGWDFLTRGTNRPYTHSLLAAGTIVLCACLATGRWRKAGLGAAFGLATHLLRDMATGGVPLYWPLTQHLVVIPYGAYATLLVAASGLIMWRGHVRPLFWHPPIGAEEQG
jgi:inner membrane protein